MNASHLPINTHTHTHTNSEKAAMQSAHWKQLGVRCLAQGHFDPPPRGIEPATLRLLDNYYY